MMTNPKVDAVGCNGIAKAFPIGNFYIPFFYDPYAFEELDSPTAKWKEQNPVLAHFLSNSQLQFNSPVRQVKSAFGGFALYRTAAMEGNRYCFLTDNSGKPKCEHKSFHEKMNFWYNPKMIHLVNHNP